ncbi:hypothetical protein K2X30_15015 [bacterium]|jgi:hypothetical protein|nr:hypothetical protein [bacterium]
MKKIIFAISALLTLNAQAFENVPLSDFGGKHLSLYGLTDYTETVKLLKKNNVTPVAYGLGTQGLFPAYNADGSVDTKNAKYAIVGIVFYNANYAFMEYNPLANPFGEVKPRTMPQFFLSYAIENPASEKNDVAGDYAANRAQYNPYIPGLYFDRLTTSDLELLAKGKQIWLNPWQLGKAGVFEYNYDPSKRNDFQAEASFFTPKDVLLASAKLGKSSQPTQLFERMYRANAIATSQVGKTLYPIESNDTMLQRPYDATVDTYQLGPSVKSTLEGLKWVPFLWQSSANFKSKVYENYVTGH